MHIIMLIFGAIGLLIYAIYEPIKADKDYKKHIEDQKRRGLR